MSDRDKVIKGLEHHSRCQCSFGKDDICPYWSEENDSASLCRDALQLLKEQKPVKPIRNGVAWVCGNCGKPIVSVNRVRIINGENNYQYCKVCGNEVKWDE